MIGMGVVGGNTAIVLKKAHTIYPYDKYKKPYNDSEHLDSLAENSQVVFLCVPTPMKGSGEIDYSPMQSSLETLFETSKRVGRNPEDILVTIRSTAVSGTTDDFASKFPFKFAFNPEFLRENYALEDMLNTNRVILGVEDESSKEKLLDVYKPLFPNAKILFYNRKTSEMIKYAANVSLFMQTMAANEIYQVCKALDIDYNEVKEAILFDDRIGRNIEVPGPDGYLGAGGKCFPKDVNAFIYLARASQYRPYLIEEAWRLNEKVRENKDWLDIPGATSENKDFSKE